MVNGPRYTFGPSARSDLKAHGGFATAKLRHNGP